MSAKKAPGVEIKRTKEEKGYVLQKAKEKAGLEDRPLKEGDYIPACVETCPAGAMYFGDLDNPEHKVWELARSPRAFRLLEEIGTLPKVVYLMESEWQSGKKG